MQRLSFDFPANTGMLSKIGELAVYTGQRAGFNEREIGDIQLAVDEACTNAIIHGLKKDPNLMFQLVIRWDKGEVEILIRESGEPFDPSDTAEPDIKASLEERHAGGLGLYFVKEVMDQVDYWVDERGLKTLRMVKIAKQL